MSVEIGRFPREFRRAATLAVTRGALYATRRLPPRAVISLGAALGAAAGTILPLRARLLTNLALGLGRDHVPHGTAGIYFQKCLLT